MIDINTKEGMRQAVEWTEQHIAKLKEGGVWLVPRSGTVVTVFASQRRVSIVGVLPDTSIARVFKAMGYEVVDGSTLD